jgi:hypothetical protein
LISDLKKEWTVVCSFFFRLLNYLEEDLARYFIFKEESFSTYVKPHLLRIEAAILKPKKGKPKEI